MDKLLQKSGCEEQHYKVCWRDSGSINEAYWILSSNSSFIQYCDSNIGLFSFATYKVIALPTIATAMFVALTHF